MNVKAIFPWVLGAIVLIGVVLLQMTRTPESVVPDFAAIQDVGKKKQAFFSYLAPLIVAETQAILEERKDLERIDQILAEGTRVSARDQDLLAALGIKYRVPDRDQLSTVNLAAALLFRIDEVPMGLALAQAANESAWGTSRFAVAGKNMFGQWCYREGCGMVPNEREGGAKHEVRSFNTITESVNAYLFNLNTNSFYEDFRLARAEMRLFGRGLNSFELASHLNRYSERGEAYVDEIQTLIEQNFLTNRDYSSYEKP